MGDGEHAPAHDGSYEIPSTLDWDGQPSLNWNATTQNWNAADTTYNANLSVTVVDYMDGPGRHRGTRQDAHLLQRGHAEMGAHHTASQTLAKELLDRMWTLYRDAIGVSAPETRRDYNRFDDPSSCRGLHRRDAQRRSDQARPTFIGIRSDFRSDPDWPQVQAYLDGGPAPTFTTTASGPRSTSRLPTRSTAGSSPDRLTS